MDRKNAASEGSSALSEAYKKLGRPYMRGCAISSSITYQFIMSPLMCKLLAEADFLETDTTYNENTELTYLFNATVFDYTTIKWAVVACKRGNKESSEFYCLAFKLMFDTCHQEHSHFKVGETLKGIIIDWSDTKSKGLREVIGEETAELVLKSCSVHWTRYYQKVAVRVYCSVSKGNRRAAVEAFCLIAKNIMIVAESSMYYNCLMCCMTQESSSEKLRIPLSEEQITMFLAVIGQVPSIGWNGGQEKAIYKC